MQNTNAILWKTSEHWTLICSVLFHKSQLLQKWNRAGKAQHGSGVVTQMTCLYCLLCDNLKYENRDASANPDCQAQLNQEMWRAERGQQPNRAFRPCERVLRVLERGNKSVQFPNSREAVILPRSTLCWNATWQARRCYCDFKTKRGGLSSHECEGICKAAPKAFSFITCCNSFICAWQGVRVRTWGKQTRFLRRLQVLYSSFFICRKINNEKCQW